MLRRMMSGDYVQRGFAELVGAFALVFVGAGAAIYQDLVAIALAYGLVIAVMVSAVGHISGGHFNPAVTLGFLVTRRIAPSLAVCYWLCQLGGATLAALLLRWVLPSGSADAGAPALNTTIDTGKGVAIEAVLTFFLVWVFFASVADPRGTFRQIAGLAIGLTITLDVLMAAGLTGAAMNPARAFGPQLVNNHWGDFWVWYVGPLAGGILAAVVYEMLYLRPSRPDAAGYPDSGLDEPAVAEAATTLEPAAGTDALD
jgi:aquaporin Z